jgi:luciferase family oxidoreductase group 1
MTFSGPVGVLDYVSITDGGNAHEAIDHTIELARHVEALGFRRHWFSEHHNTRSLACTAPELIIARVGAETSTLRVGAGGIMLPNHSPLKVAETFRTLEAMFPGRIDLGLGRAPGTDGITALALRRSRQAVLADDFPALAAELFAFLGWGEGFPDDHAFSKVVAAPEVPTRPEVWMLGSSDYGARFAAVNGLATAFAHQINPEPAVEVLQAYRREFQPSAWQPEPRALLSTNAFASHDPEEVHDFEAFWTLSMTKIRRGERTPTSLTDAREFAASPRFVQAKATMGARLFAGPPADVADGLRQLATVAGADELMIVTPSADHGARLRSYELLAGELGLEAPVVAASGALS